MIPKTIHYCWFGGNPLPKLAIKCINSWKKYCPDFRIVEWNETNFDVNCCQYVKEAYCAKKWAFVSDYARFKILYEHGGIYLDTDVELLKPLKSLAERGAFMGFENDSIKTVNPGLCLAAPAGLGIFEEIINGYHTRQFIYPDKTISLTTVVDYTTDILKKHGLCNVSGIQSVAGVYIYPSEYFNPMNMDTGKLTITENTVSIHHFAASWVDSYSKFRGKVYRFIFRVFGKKVAEWTKSIIGRK